MSKRNAHIAIFIYGLSGGGATRRTLTLAEGFAARGHRVDLVVVTTGGELADGLPDGVKLVVLDSMLIRMAGRRKKKARKRRIQASAFALARYQRRERPDVVMSAANHVHLTSLFAKRLAFNRVPLVLRISNHLTRSHMGGTTRPRPYRLQLARWMYAWADAVITVAAELGEDLVRHTRITETRVDVIANPTYSPDILVAAAAPLEHPFFAAGAPPVLLGAGRLSPAKDFETLVRAFARVRAKRPARLVILGEGKQRARIEALARELEVADDVDLPGFVDNPFAWMSRAAVFVLSSAWEGSPGVLIEAMACGCPVVSTDCPSGPSEIMEKGRHGPLVEVGDDAALADAVLATLEAPPDTESLRARAGEFDVDRAVDRYLGVLLAHC